MGSANNIQIEPVGRRSRDGAIRFLLFGDCESPVDLSRVEAMKKLFQSRRKGARMLWHATAKNTADGCKRRCIAVVMIVGNPGRVGMLFHSPLSAAGVDAEALAMLLQTVRREVMGKELAFVQTLLSPDAWMDISAMEAGGLELLAELIYMKRDIPTGTEFSADAGASELTWRSFGQFDEAELADVISATYEGTLDCSPLVGVREMSDVIAGHKAGGHFTPSKWWIAERNGRPVGCIMVNDSHTRAIAEVVYLGVVPSCRGQLVGRALLAKAIRSARKEKKFLMTLAVDSRNDYARKLYESTGFQEIFRRMVYVIACWKKQ